MSFNYVNMEGIISDAGDILTHVKRAKIQASGGRGMTAVTL